MLTAEENELLCRVEGDAPMGQHHAPALDAGLPGRGGRRARRHAGEVAAAAARISSSSATPKAGSACSTNIARIGARRSRLGRNEECGLRCLYHGWKIDVDGNVLEMASEPPESGSRRQGQAQGLSGARGRRLRLDLHGPGRDDAGIRAAGLRADRDTRVCIAKIHVRATGRRSSRAQIDSAHSSSLHSSDMVPARVDGAEATDTNWLRPSTDKAPRLEVERTPLRLPLCRAAPADQERQHARLRARHGLRRAVHRADSAEQQLQRREPARADRTTRTRHFYFIAWGDGETPDRPETWRKFHGAQVGIDLDDDYQQVRTRENNYLQDRQAMKLGDFTGINGIPEPGHRDVGDDGPDRRPQHWSGSARAISPSSSSASRWSKRRRPLQKDGTVIGRTEPRVPQNKLRSFEGVAPKTTDWRLVGLTEEELSARGLKPPTQSAAE